MTGRRKSLECAHRPRYLPLGTLGIDSPINVICLRRISASALHGRALRGPGGTRARQADVGGLGFAPRHAGSPG